jgi:hypothetical protein
MTANVSFNPYSTSVPNNPFLNPTQGYISGFALDDPSSRMWLTGGILGSTDTIPMWGGVPISEQINNLGGNSEGLGPTVQRATSQANTTGFSVYNQAGSMVITPGGNSAPIAVTGNFVPFYRVGSHAVRIAVNCAPALIAGLTAGELINVSNLFWDPTNMWVNAGSPSGSEFALPTTIQLLSVQSNSKTISYNSGTGAVTWTTGDAAILLI